MARFIYLNGEYISANHAAIHPEDRGFLMGDAVYEVIACIHGHHADETGHLDRLERSLNELHMPMPVERETLRFLMRELLRRNKQKNAAIYIQITRGVAKRDFKFPSPKTPQTLMMMTPDFDFDSNTGVLNGWRVKTVKDTRWKRRDIKTTLLLSQSLAKQTAAMDGFDDSWMVDDEGFITEASAANAYIVKDNKIITRPVTVDILKGTTRNAVGALCLKNHIKFEERKFTPQEAYDADEAFCTGATTQITSVIEIDGHRIGDGTQGVVAKNIFQEYRAYVQGLRGQQVSWEAGL